MWVAEPLPDVVVLEIVKLEADLDSSNRLTCQVEAGPSRTRA